jgi:predicted transposase YbfD/YdcC
MFAGLLDQIPGLDGAVITADALHAQREHATYLPKRGAHYIFTVKGNQPGLHRQLRSLPWKDVPAGHSQTGRGHGRIEKRTVKAVTVTAGLHFPYAQQAIQITRRTRRINGARWRTETSYAITSLPAEQARPARLAEWIRGHWKIEVRHEVAVRREALRTEGGGRPPRWGLGLPGGPGPASEIGRYTRGTSAKAP